MNLKKILIVEDEFIIAYSISIFLKEKGYHVIGIANSMDEAITYFQQSDIDIVLIDIKLKGDKTGIDLGHYINEHYSIPFIYLTSQVDSKFLDQAKLTHPKGYLSKPFQKNSLYPMLEIITAESENKVDDYLWIKEGSNTYKIKIDDIIYLQADHTYTKVQSNKRKYPFLIRQSLQKTLDQLNEKLFIQIHRTWVVNIKKIEEWNTKMVKINHLEIPISRTRRKKILQLLTNESMD